MVCAKKFDDNLMGFLLLGYHFLFPGCPENSLSIFDSCNITCLGEGLLSWDNWVFCWHLAFEDAALSIGLGSFHQLFVWIVSLFPSLSPLFSMLISLIMLFFMESNGTHRVLSFFHAQVFSFFLCIICRFLSLISLIIFSFWSALFPKLTSLFFISLSSSSSEFLFSLVLKFQSLW